jgi:SSS family solute:Na+ symporter
VNAALLIIFGTILGSAVVGVFAGRRGKMNLETWTVGGRRFGIVLIWLLMAGEIYTTFTFLGASGWAYSKGAPTYYILIYGTLAYTLSFFILPVLWKIGKRHGLHTQPDFFVKTYGSRGLGIFVAVVGLVSILPYLQLQLAGLGMIVEIASAGAISARLAILLAFVLTCVFVYTSGIRGSAWVSVIKDVMMIAAVGIAGFGVPRLFFGGFGKMFKEIIARHPGHLVFPGSAPSMDVVWVMSTVLLTGLGFYMWPHIFGSAFSAKSAKIIKRNAIIMPFYQLPIVLVFMVGFTAFLALPGLKNGDTAFLALIQKSYPSWFLGFVGAAGAVTAMVPASILVLFASTLVAKNIYQAGFNPAASEATVMRLSRAMVVVITAAALVLALFFPSALVNLLLIGYDGVSQFFPGVVLGLFWKRVTRTGVTCGLVAGIAIVVVLVFGRHDPFLGLNAGFVALAVNAVLTVGISLLAVRRSSLTAAGAPGFARGSTKS